MSAFLAAALSLPTVVFTVLLGFFLIYALLTLVGALDIEWLDGLLGVDDVNDSVLEGGLQALGVAGIPLTLFGGVSCVFAWMLSFASMQFLPSHALVQVGVGLGSAVAGVLAGAITVRPFRRLFITPDGPHRKELLMEIPRDRLQGVDDPQPGMVLTAKQNDGREMRLVVAKVSDGSVTLDGNHPLAGKTLHFDLKLLEVKQAA